MLPSGRQNWATGSRPASPDPVTERFASRSAVHSAVTATTPSARGRLLHRRGGHPFSLEAGATLAFCCRRCPLSGSKAPSAFLSIGEVAEKLDIAIHVIRFWEARIGEVRPLRGAKGQRRYRPEDVELLIGIRHLLHIEGYSIRGVQKILRERGVIHVRTCWQDQKAA